MATPFQLLEHESYGVRVGVSATEIGVSSGRGISEPADVDVRLPLTREGIDAACSLVRGLLEARVAFEARRGMRR